MDTHERQNTALIVIDVQKGFDQAVYSPTANPEAEANISRLIDEWVKGQRGPIVVVKHDSIDETSPLHTSNPGNELKSVAAEAEAALTVTKHVNSAFYGDPDLDAWLRQENIDSLVLCGIQTNMCVETTARMAGNLGYKVTVAFDATRTFDIAIDIAGLGKMRASAEELMRATAMNLSAGGFAEIRMTESILA